MWQGRTRVAKSVGWRSLAVVARLSLCAAPVMRSTLASKSINLCTAPSLLAPWPRCGASLAHARAGRIWKTTIQALFPGKRGLGQPNDMIIENGERPKATGMAWGERGRGGGGPKEQRARWQVANKNAASSTREVVR